MKREYHIRLKQCLALCVLIAGFFSCDYQELADADYPNQMVYLPVAANGIYTLNKATEEGSKIFKYELDLENNRLIVPLAVYRSGTNNKGTIQVDVLIDNDTIRQLINSGDLIDDQGKNLELIPAEQYTISPSVELKDGEGWQSITLTINLNYIATQTNKRLALGVAIEGKEVSASPKLGTAIIEINTNFLVPTPQFTYRVSSGDDKTIIFENTSTDALTYAWDLGDGTTSNQKTPPAHQYSDYKTYPVKLTVTGITQIPVTYEYGMRIWRNVSSVYMKNPGTPYAFARSDNRTNRSGNLADWTTTDNLKALSQGVLYGGFYNDAALGTVMDFFSRDAITNGKIYQTISIPAGSYKVTFNPVKFDGSNNCYFVLYAGTTFPDIEEIAGNNNIILAYNWNEAIEEQEFQLELNEEQEITIGFVISTPVPAIGRSNEIMIKSVGLYM